MEERRQWFQVEPRRNNHKRLKQVEICNKIIIKSSQHLSKLQLPIHGALEIDLKGKNFELTCLSISSNE